MAQPGIARVRNGRGSEIPQPILDSRIPTDAHYAPVLLLGMRQTHVDQLEPNALASIYRLGESPAQLDDGTTGPLYRMAVAGPRQ